jgi:hypothetical protein
MLRVTLDEATGVLAVTHTVATDLGGQTVNYAEPVALADPAAAAAALAALLDANREEMERRALAASLAHAAALAGRRKKGRKALAAGGTLKGISGGAS